MIRFGIILSILFFAELACAKQTLIQGNGIEYRNKTLKVHQYVDLFTFTTKEIAETQIGDQGNFKFEIDVAESRLLLITIEEINAHLFVEPGVKYTLLLPQPPMESTYGLGIDPFIQPEVFETGGELNMHITSLEKDLNAFAMASSMAVPNTGRTKAESFAEEIKLKYKKVTIPYFEEYLKYRMFAFLAANGSAKRNRFKEEFIQLEPSYDQLSYAQALNLVFTNFLSPYSAKAHSDSARLAITSGSYILLDKVIAEKSILKPQRIRELVLITQLHELCEEGVYNEKLIVELLMEAKSQTPFEEHKTLIDNILQKIIYLSPKTQAPNFSFQSVQSQHVELEDYNSNVVYIQFFEKLNPETLRQMSLMKVLKEGYGEDIAMFSLSLTMSPGELKNLSREYDFNWFFGSVENPQMVKRAYELRSYPTYFLIDEDGLLIQSPADVPGARIERKFAEIYENKHPGVNKPFKLQPPEVTDDSVDLK